MKKIIYGLILFFLIVALIFIVVNKKKKNDGANGAKRGNKLVFRQRRDKNPDGDKGATDQKHADNTADIQGDVRVAVKRQGNVVYDGGEQKGAAKNGEGGEIFADNNAGKRNGRRHNELIRFHFPFFADKFHGDKWNDDDE